MDLYNIIFVKNLIFKILLIPNKSNIKSTNSKIECPITIKGPCFAPFLIEYIVVTASKGPGDKAPDSATKNDVKNIVIIFI